MPRCLKYVKISTVPILVLTGIATLANRDEINTFWFRRGPSMQSAVNGLNERRVKVQFVRASVNNGVVPDYSVSAMMRHTTATPSTTTCWEWRCTCQGYSDAFGTYRYHWGLANDTIRSWWLENRCDTRPVDSGVTPPSLFTRSKSVNLDTVSEGMAYNHTRVMEGNDHSHLEQVLHSKEVDYLSPAEPMVDLFPLTRPTVDIHWLRANTHLGWHALNERMKAVLTGAEWSNSGSVTDRTIYTHELVRVTVFNAQRGTNWRKICNLIRSDKILSATNVWILNEMDYGMARTGNEHTTKLLANCLGMNYAFGVEFIELNEGLKVDQMRAQALGLNASLGYHGNAIITDFRIKRARVLRFNGSEQFWFKDCPTPESRIGGRMALIASLDMGTGYPDLAVVATHTENSRFKGWQDYNVRALKAVASELASAEIAVFGGHIPTRVSNKKRRTANLDILHTEAGFAYADQSNEEHAFENGASGDWLMTKGFAYGTNAVNTSERATVVSSRRLSDHNFVTAALRPNKGVVGNDITPGFPVDVVYTWVGEPSEKKWDEYMAICTARIAPGIKYHPSTSRGRFRDWGTLQYSLRSVRRYLPWVRRVFLLTNGDGLPAFLSDAQGAVAAGITLVTHEDIWPEDRKETDLPTFNSDAIESHLHRIPGLAERFLYVQDDMLIGRALSRSVFFFDSGEPILQQPTDIHEMPGHLVRGYMKSCFASLWISNGNNMARASSARCRKERSYSAPLGVLSKTCGNYRPPKKGMKLDQAYISNFCTNTQRAGNYGCVPRNASVEDMRAMITGRGVVVFNDAYEFSTLQDERRHRALITEVMKGEWPDQLSVPPQTRKKRHSGT